MLYVNVANEWLYRTPQSHTIFLLKELIIHLKISGSKTNLQQFHNGCGLQGRLFCQSVIIMEFIIDGLKGFINWYLTEETANVKVKKSS
jgi:hypothetical protein